MDLNIQSILKGHPRTDKTKKSKKKKGDDDDDDKEIYN